jgi:SH3-like domain-containing protein
MNYLSLSLSSLRSLKSLLSLKFMIINLTHMSDRMEKQVGVAVANMYGASHEDSSVVSQILYGQKVTIKENKQDFTLIQTRDGYQGWVKEEVLYPFLFHPLKAHTIHNCCHVYSVPDLTQKKPLISLPFGVAIDILAEPTTENSRWIQIQLINGFKGWIQRGDLIFNKPILTLAQMVELSHQFLGLPYTWGGTSSFGYDCSGFIQMLFNEMGILLPRDAEPQLHSQFLSPVGDEELQAGDLIFYGAHEGSIKHVSLYLGNQKIIHASTLPKPVLKIHPKDIYTLKECYPYSTMRRVSLIP